MDNLFEGSSECGDLLVVEVDYLVSQIVLYLLSQANCIGAFIISAYFTLLPLMVFFFFIYGLSFAHSLGGH